MSIEDKISSFIKDMGYLNNEHVLGVFFYGSYLTGLNTDNSDIDLHIIFDNEEPDHLIRGNKVVDGTRIEYFEKPIDDIYQTVNEDYINQNNATLTIFGTSKIIYAKDTQLKQLQEYVINKFSNPLPPLSDDEAKEQVSILNNRMEKLEKYAETNNPYFEHLYHLTIDKIRRFYHNLMGISRIETSKGFRIYNDEKYIENMEKRVASIIGVLIISILTLCLTYYFAKDKVNDKYIDESSYPVQACDYILKNIDLGKARFYNEYNYGSYMLFRGIPVFIDSRADLYAPEFSGKSDDIFMDFIETSGIAKFYEDIFKKYDITHVITYENSKMNMIIEKTKDPNYKQLYKDDYFVVYERLSN